jgi:hypothetical protein
MRRFRDLIRAHKKFSFGLWIVVLVAVVAGAQWQLTGRGSTTETQVLAAQAKKPDTTPPSVSISFPVKNGVYGPDTWTGCAPAGICGTASDATGVSSVSVAVQQGNGSYWNGSSFASTGPFYNLAAGTTTWSLPLSLPPDGTYTVSVQAADPVGNASKPVSLSFQVDSIAVNNKVFGISGSLTGSFSPGVQQSLNVVLTNPYNFPIKVTGVTVRVEPTTAKATGGANPACDGTENLTVVSQAPFTSTHPVTVPAGPGGSYTLKAAEQPVLQMPDLDKSQDDCKNTTFKLSYTGTATK